VPSGGGVASVRLGTQVKEEIMRPFLSILAVALAFVAPGGGPTPARAHGAHFPDVIQLPTGFRPEGITHDGNTLFVANFDHGAIFQVNARTGKGSILVPAFPREPGGEDRMGLGIKLDRRTGHLFVAGGGTGHAYVYDGDTGASLANYTLAASGPTFINDLLIVGDVVYFTDSFRPSFFKLTLLPGGGLPPQSAVQEIPITGDFEFIPGPGNFNNNGIERTPDGKALIVINSKNGKLYRLNPRTGVTQEIAIASGATLPTGDGLLLDGHTLFVVQNTNNIAVVALSRRHRNQARIVDNITNPNFDTLATATKVGDALYVTNPRFQVADPTGQPFSVVRVPLDDDND
jgi:sugar lactone lactonase YvrE